ncbi:MAG: co-chaperone YbbN [Proteobacteria bacterium]|nr:co-chaperone YbbN [Pseudomonadota bacterium]
MQTGLGLSSRTPAAISIKDTDELHFEQDVLTASMRTPVIVDFWAPWCVPCQQLTPILEKAVTKANGAFQMVKVNIDKSPGLAQALRIQSVPTVYAFFQGKPVDGFSGAKTEAELRSFIDQLQSLAAPLPASDEIAAQVKTCLMAADQFFQQENILEAMNEYSKILDVDPQNTDALGGIGWCLMAQGDIASVHEMVAQLPPDLMATSRLQGLKFILSLRERTEDLEDTFVLEQKLHKAPQNLQTCFDLSLQYLATGSLKKGIDTLLSLIKKERDWKEKKARLLLLEIFEALGHTHPLTLYGRRQLSAVLFS